MKHHKPATERKTVAIQVRVTAEQHKLFKRAARAKGCAVSYWLRNAGIAVEQRERRVRD